MENYLLFCIVFFYLPVLKYVYLTKYWNVLPNRLLQVGHVHRVPPSCQKYKTSWDSFASSVGIFLHLLYNFSCGLQNSTKATDA